MAKLLKTQHISITSQQPSLVGCSFKVWKARELHSWVFHLSATSGENQTELFIWRNLHSDRNVFQKLPCFSGEWEAHCRAALSALYTYKIIAPPSDKCDSYPAGRMSHELKAMQTGRHPHKTKSHKHKSLCTEHYLSSLVLRVVDVTAIILMREETQNLAFSLALPPIEPQLHHNLFSWGFRSL